MPQRHAKKKIFIPEYDGNSVCDDRCEKEGSISSHGSLYSHHSRRRPIYSDEFLTPCTGKSHSLIDHQVDLCAVCSCSNVYGKPNTKFSERGILTHFFLTCAIFLTAFPIFNLLTSYQAVEDPTSETLFDYLTEKEPNKRNFFQYFTDMNWFTFPHLSGEIVLCLFSAVAANLVTAACKYWLGEDSIFNLFRAKLLKGHFQ